MNNLVVRQKLMARFQSAQTAKEEQCLLERATPTSMKYATKWALKIFNEWKAARQIKGVNSAVNGVDDVRPIQPLTTSLAEMHVTSLAFWLRKFVGEAANSKGERYPSHTLYCIMSGLNRHLLDVRSRDSKYLGQK